MAYNIRDVFYLDTSATVTAGTPGAGSAQLELSAYIDPIARGKSKAVGLAVYKVQWIVSQDAASEPMDDAEVGSFRAGLVAGLGAGDLATGAFSPISTIFRATNDLLVASYDFYGPRSMSTHRLAHVRQLEPISTRMAHDNSQHNRVFVTEPRGLTNAIPHTQPLSIGR